MVQLLPTQAGADPESFGERDTILKYVECELTKRRLDTETGVNKTFQNVFTSGAY